MLLDDLRHAVRRLARRRGLSLSIVVILALGIGISTAVFGVVKRVLLQPLPVAGLDRLVVAWETNPQQPETLIEVSFPYFLDWRARSRSFEDLAAFSSVNWGYELKGPPRRESVTNAAVSASFFDTLRARPLLGRTFLPHEDAPESARVIVLSYALWQSRFAGDPAVVGTTVIADEGLPFTIVGVMPREFDFPQGAQVWSPVGPELEKWRRQDKMTPQAFRGLGVLYVVGRLKAGTMPAEARKELASLSRDMSLADGFSAVGWDAQVVPLVDHYLGQSTRQALSALSVASGVVLLLACANVAVLLLIQALARRGELAVRQALGAGAARLARDPILDAALLATCGGVAGALLARWMVQAVVALGPPEMPGLRDATVDGPALAFALAATLASAALVALMPAWLASRRTLAPLLKTDRSGPDRRGARLTRLLVTAEVALSIVLLVGSGLTVRSLRNLLTVPLGFVPAQTLSFSVGLPSERYPDVAARHAFHRALLERLAALPDVQAAGAVHNRPLELGPIGSDNHVMAEGIPLDLASVTAHSLLANWEPVTPDYFRAVGTRLLHGRTFSEHDTKDAPKVVVVSDSLARRLWPGQNPLGKRLHTYGAKSDFVDGRFVNVEWQTVVGVVEDARYRGVQNPRHDIYLAYEQAPNPVQHVVLRTSGDPLALAGVVRAQVSALDAEATVDRLTTMAGLVERALAPWRFASLLLTLFAAAALVLTASGLFAVLQHFVSGRTREIAIRMAVGAEPRRVLAYVLRQGLGITALGVALGLGASLALSRSLSALLYGVTERDPRSFLAGAALIALVAVVACLWPARRAARVDPAVALRAE